MTVDVLEIDVENYQCVYAEIGVCSHPDLTLDVNLWPGEISLKYCSQCPHRKPS